MLAAQIGLVIENKPWKEGQVKCGWFFNASMDNLGLGTDRQCLLAVDKNFFINMYVTGLSKHDTLEWYNVSAMRNWNQLHH